MVKGSGFDTESDAEPVSAADERAYAEATEAPRPLLYTTLP